MGGLGSGRKKKDDLLDPSEIVAEDNGTVMGAEPPKTRKSGTKAKAGVKVDEARNKINLLFSGLARVFNREYPYTEADFTAEAQGLVRLSDKFSIIGYVITLLDPFFIGLSLVQKFLKMPKKKPQTQVQNDQPAQEAGNVVNFR